jgi:hypothetical protein
VAKQGRKAEGDLNPRGVGHRGRSLVCRVGVEHLEQARQHLGPRFHDLVVHHLPIDPWIARAQFGKVLLRKRRLRLRVAGVPDVSRAMRWSACSRVSLVAHDMTPATAGTTPRSSRCSWLLSGREKGSQAILGPRPMARYPLRGRDMRTVGFEKPRE